MDVPVIRQGIPRHEQISSWLREGIDSGTWGPDARLPSENELCETFSVSRVTIRRALQTLEADGVIYRRHGLGSFVCPRKMAQGLVRLTDFAQDMLRAGKVPTSEVLHRAYEASPAEIAENLALSPGDPVLRIDRLRMGDQEPIAFDRTWIPPFYAQLIEGGDLTGETLYQLLEREHGIPVLSGRYRIAAESAGAEIAERLQVPPGTALLVLERMTRTVGDRAIYFQRRVYRADRMSYELEVARDPRQPGTEADAGVMPLREFDAVMA
ncbi:MAG: GntR family transcriptional regulator [Gemmatimonadota bacterium]|nr:GntR family transcriptional regulator [Gemmatimonadota bacterium]